MEVSFFFFSFRASAMCAGRCLQAPTRVKLHAVPTSKCTAATPFDERRVGGDSKQAQNQSSAHTHTTPTSHCDIRADNIPATISTHPQHPLPAGLNLTTNLSAYQSPRKSVHSTPSLSLPLSLFLITSPDACNGEWHAMHFACAM